MLLRRFPGSRRLVWTSSRSTSHVWTAADTETRCQGHTGFFSAPETGNRVDLCLDYSEGHLGTHLRHKLVLHELAHAWIHIHVTDTTRHAFLDTFDIAGWNDHNHPHATRGTEIAADAVMYALHPDEPANDTQTCGYELITGQPTPFDRVDSCSDGPAAALLASMAPTRRPRPSSPRP